MTSRDHILEEIRRTARENGGKPLGRQRFATETGIRQSDWYGKFWSAWGEALIEAGYCPNRLVRALPEERLAECIVVLIRELGKYPTAGQLRVRSHRDPDWPSHNVFRRLGDKVTQARKVIAFCQERGGLEDVIAICSPIAVAAEGEPDSEERSQEEWGYVYLCRSGKHYKIGRSNSVGRREYELSIQLPEKLAVVHQIRTDDPTGIEAYWHKRFEGRRKNGEWFQLTPEDVKAFKRRKFM